MSGVTIRNQLGKIITNVEVTFATSTKGTSLLSYAFNWSTVNVMKGVNVEKTTKVDVGTVESGESKTVKKEMMYRGNKRGYWQVHFTYNGIRYAINKNNAQANPWPMDNRTEPEITILWAGAYIKFNFVFKSGNAYFYAKEV